MGARLFYFEWEVFLRLREEFLMQIFPNSLQIRSFVSVCNNIPHFCILDGYS